MDDYQTSAHCVATACVARLLSRTPIEKRTDLLLGFLHAAASGLIIYKGPRGAADDTFQLADHLCGLVAA